MALYCGKSSEKGTKESKKKHRRHQQESYLKKWLRKNNGIVLMQLTSALWKKNTHTHIPKTKNKYTA